ncbi:flagellar export chaperone FliS [Isachenkonia alkalipeptolytica]|uniref:Flagellar secretion chaperone FliS n=1 Tax=Isachenkonia alkalipeptolytica TaxID=2565777 RepID=A0AA44BEL4_9CLOT|nr:flagellar export chaperone FliS [Isachenkonia alkalipeptolytica]NBG89399.1 flagellar export chaperone FliS [Isachenkonia alkalipeptolytica]
MAVRNPYNTYKENSVKTASPEELTLMLYNGALKFINKGKMGIEGKNIQEANEGIKRAQDIIHELNNSLNMDYEMSKNMRSLYTYILEKLVEGNIKKTTEPLDEAKEMITELRDTWKEAMKIAKGKR